jgi:hypothetical protein
MLQQPPSGRSRPAWSSLRHFAGLGHDEIAAVLGITVYLARQKWTYARAWLRHALGG